MKLRCLCCGTTTSLDSLLNNEDARISIMTLSEIGGEITKWTILYCGLFRPQKGSLSFARLNTLLEELLVDIKAQRIQRNGQTHDAPLDAWIYAFKTVIQARDIGKLQTPLKSHGYLYEVILSYKPSNTIVESTSTISAKQSQMMSGLQKLEAMKNG